MENPVYFYKNSKDVDLSSTMELETDELTDFHQVDHTEIYFESILSSSTDLSTILESQIDETKKLRQVDNTKSYLEPILSPSNKKGTDFVNSGTASNRKRRLPPSITKGSKDLKLKKRKKKKNKSAHHKLSHNVSAINKSVKVFGLVERNESSQELTTVPSFPRKR